MSQPQAEPALVLDFACDPAVAGCPESGWFERIARTTLAVAAFERPAELSLVVTTDEEVRALNAEYRGLDEPTDVLSFALLDSVPDAEDYFPEARIVPRVQGGFVTPPDAPVHLGDVVISFPRAVEQARLAEHDTSRELAHLTAHGILHLLGYDHQQPDDEALMRTKEQEILDRVL